MENQRPDVPDILKEEYFHLQEAVEKYDEHLLTFKQWSVTISLVGLGASFVEGTRWLALVSAIGALLFWIIECLWKGFQNAHYYRLKNIEKYLNQMDDRTEGFRYPYITFSWGRGMEKNIGFIRRMFWPQVMFPHFVIVILGVAIFFADWELGIIDSQEPPKAEQDSGGNG